MLQPKRRTHCFRCGAELPASRRTFCGDSCRRKTDRSAFAQKYRDDADTRRKQRARIKARYHLRTVQPCEVCGTTDDVQRHHPDHSRPLEIRWRCRRHHAELHRQERRAA